MKVLLVEDEKALAESIVAYLRKENILCEVASDYITGFDKIISFEYDCILLDISLPGGSGLNLLRKLQEMKKTSGVIIISAHSSLDDKLGGLKLGADDYLTKPFHLSELTARIEALVRRRKFGGVIEAQFGAITFHLDSKSISVNNVSVALSKSEYELLLYLSSNKNRVVSKNAIAEHLSGDEAEIFDSLDFIYAHIKNLKKKLAAAGCPDYIKSIYGIGYKFELKE